MSERDEILVDRCRKAAENLALALEDASQAGLLLECSASHTGSQMEGNRLIKQFAWFVRVHARRVVHL